MGFFSGNIRKRVLATVEKRIVDGQKEFEAERRTEDQHLAEGISALTMAHTRNLLEAETRIVGSILG